MPVDGSSHLLVPSIAKSDFKWCIFLWKRPSELEIYHCEPMHHFCVKSNRAFLRLKVLRKLEVPLTMFKEAKGNHSLFRKSPFRLAKGKVVLLGLENR